MSGRVLDGCGQGAAQGKARIKARGADAPAGGGQGVPPLPGAEDAGHHRDEFHAVLSSVITSGAGFCSFQ